MSNKQRFVKTVHNKGIVFSFEAIMALILFALMLASIHHQTPHSLKELAILQQENDLLRVWSTKDTSTNEMISDSQKLLGDPIEVWVNENKILEAKQKGENKIATEGTILDNLLQENKIKLIVYYN